MTFGVKQVTPLAILLRGFQSTIETEFATRTVDVGTEEEVLFDAVVTNALQELQTYPVSSEISTPGTLDGITSTINATLGGSTVTYPDIEPSPQTLTVTSSLAGTTSVDEHQLTGFIQTQTAFQSAAISETSLSFATQQVNLTPTQEAEIYTTQDHANAVYVRNPNRRVPEADLTSLSPWNNRIANLRAGIAITPRNFLMSTHARIPVGDIVRFVSANGDVYDREVVDQQRVFQDLSIARLDSDLPSDITPALLPPANFADFFSNVGRQYSLCFFTDQEEKLHAGAFASITDQIVDINQSTVDGREIYFEDLISGDSGSPYFMLINNVPVATHVAWTTAENGSSVHSRLNDIQTYCGVTGHSATIADFTGFDL